MSLVVYKLWSSSTAATSAAAQAQVLNKGRIVGTVLSAGATGGGATGRYAFQLSVNQATQTISVNNPPRENILNEMDFATFTASDTTKTSGFIPMDRPVSAGDQLYLAQAFAGTAAASMTTRALIFVEE